MALEFIIIPAVAFLASLITFFSGFGLGTVLTPFFLFFFDLELAIAMTAIVHLLNNLFKLALTYRKIEYSVFFKFGIPAIIAAYFGAASLKTLSQLAALGTFEFFEVQLSFEPLKVTIGIIMILFALMDLIPKLKGLQFSRKYLLLGGFLSGYFGGLSGHQGALRSAFLAKSNLSKEQFIASGVAIACVIDFVRIFAYSKSIWSAPMIENSGLLTITTLTGFAGAYLGNHLLKGVSLSLIRSLIGILLFVIAALLILGLI